MCLLLYRCQVAFYNWHLPFYENYMHMMTRLARLTWDRYVWAPGPLRCVALLAVVPFVASANLAVRSFALSCDFQFAGLTRAYPSSPVTGIRTAPPCS